MVQHSQYRLLQMGGKRQFGNGGEAGGKHGFPSYKRQIT